jgi:hypothetical protein
LFVTSSKYFQSAAVIGDGILIPNLHKALFVSHFFEISFNFMLYLIITILTIIYIFSIPVIRKKKFGNRTISTLRIIVFSATALLVVILIAESYNIYPREYWFVKGLFWVIVFSCMIIVGLCKTESINSIEKRIYRIIFFLPLIFVIFLLIPFVGVAYGLFFYVKFIGDKEFILYNDNQIRIEQPFVRFLGPNPQPIIFIKNELTCYKDTTLPFGYDDAKDKIDVIKNDDTTYKITIKSPNNWQIPSGTESFIYHLKNKLK